MGSSRIMRRPEVELETGLSKATLYRMVNSGAFRGNSHRPTVCGLDPSRDFGLDRESRAGRQPYGRAKGRGRRIHGTGMSRQRTMGPRERPSSVGTFGHSGRSAMGRDELTLLRPGGVPPSELDDAAGTSTRLCRRFTPSGGLASSRRARVARRAGANFLASRLVPRRMGVKARWRGGIAHGASRTGAKRLLAVSSDAPRSEACRYPMAASIPAKSTTVARF